jgi:hypothetical protein
MADAKAKYDSMSDQREEKQHWLVVMGIIRQAIDRGEPWPSEENA